MTRSGVIASEAGSYGAGPDELAWTPDERPLVALRGLMPKWIPRAFELTRLVGGAGFMATPSLADVEGPLAARDRALLPGARRGRPRPHPPLPPGLGPDRLRPRLARRAVRALLPAGRPSHDRAGLHAGRQDGRRRRSSTASCRTSSERLPDRARASRRGVIAPPRRRGGRALEATLEPRDAPAAGHRRLAARRAVRAELPASRQGTTTRRSSWRNG